MASVRTPAQSHAQLPAGDEIFLDHVGHFVASAEAARSVLAAVGFTPTPVSIQTNPDPAGGPPKLTGTGNVCAMLRGGYLEMLFKTADTPLGVEFDAARRRYDGLHLAAFAIADAASSHRRLAASGFPVLPVVAMQRPVETGEGPGVAAFEVVRVAAGAMPEGRVQVLRHLTEATVWQPRWLDHPNTAERLSALSLVVADIEEAAARFARFTGRPVHIASAEAATSKQVARIFLDRGSVELLSATAWRQRWPQVQIPALPFMAEVTIAVASLDAARRCLATAGLPPLPTSQANIASFQFPPALGHGVWTFVGAIT